MFFKQPCDTKNNEKKKRHIKHKKILSSTSAQALNDITQNLHRSNSFTTTENTGSHERLLDCDNFSNTFPWIGLDVPEVIDKSLENVRLILELNNFINQKFYLQDSITCYTQLHS